MTIKILFLLIFGLANYPLPIRAEDEKKTCPAHEKWTVIQRRKYGNVDFERNWTDYANGFGDCDGDLWLGLETLYELTKGDDMSLEINMITKADKYLGEHHLVVRYSHFSVGPESDNYTLYVSGFSGNATEDGLSWGVYDEKYRTDGFGHYGYDCSYGCSIKDRPGYEYGCRCGFKIGTRGRVTGDRATRRWGTGGWWSPANCGNLNARIARNISALDGIWWMYEREMTLLRYSEMKIFKRPGTFQLREEYKKACPASENGTVIQRRKFGNVNFNRDWSYYVYGFGDCDGDLWLGLESLHQLTKGNDMSLEINMISYAKNSLYYEKNRIREELVARYSNFRIGPGWDKYRLHVSGYSGNASDGLEQSNNVRFDAYDASACSRGWWSDLSTRWCGTDLNGNFSGHAWSGMKWKYPRRDYLRRDPEVVYFLRYSEMKIYKRPSTRSHTTIASSRSHTSGVIFAHSLQKGSLTALCLSITLSVRLSSL